MANPSAAWKAGHPWSYVYDFFVERESLARVVGGVAFGTDTRLLYDAIDKIGELPDGSSVLDIPTGGGVALRGIRGDQNIRYVAADISPTMLDKARQTAEQRGLTNVVEIREADVEQLPFEQDEFDLVISFAGLHCFPDPRAATREIARVTKPDGHFTGSVFLTGTGVRYLPGILAGRAAGVMGPSGTRDDLEWWLRDAGFEDIGIELSGAIGYFDARKPAAQKPRSRRRTGQSAAARSSGA